MAQSTTVIPADVISELEQHIANNQPKAITPDFVVDMDFAQRILQLVAGARRFGGLQRV